MVVTEAMAALQAMEFCRGRSLLKIILKVDSLQVVSTIKNQKFIWATHGQIIVDILDVLRYFQVWEVCHIK
jgi:ribonuclease HI